MSNPAGMTPLEKLSLKLNAVSALVSIAVAVISASRLRPGEEYWGILLALSAGALGGLVHEFAQSRGTIMLIQRNEDGLYFGSLAGVVLGMVAGLLVARGPLTTGDGVSGVGLFYEAFVAGLALKGVIEATGGQLVPAREPGGTGAPDSAGARGDAATPGDASPPGAPAGPTDRAGQPT